MLSEKRRTLLKKLENVTRQFVFSDYSKPYKPGLWYKDEQQKSQKYFPKYSPPMDDKTFLRSFYKFGSTEYRIIKVLDKLITYLEKEYSLDIESKKETME